MHWPPSVAAHLAPAEQCKALADWLSNARRGGRAGLGLVEGCSMTRGGVRLGRDSAMTKWAARN
eukprot:15046301-Alexandrium_andersonii.AAC.1